MTSFRKGGLISAVIFCALLTAAIAQDGQRFPSITPFCEIPENYDNRRCGKVTFLEPQVITELPMVTVVGGLKNFLQRNGLAPDSFSRSTIMTGTLIYRRFDDRD